MSFIGFILPNMAKAEEDSQVEGAYEGFWTPARMREHVDIIAVFDSLMNSIDSNNSLNLLFLAYMQKRLGENHPEVKSRDELINQMIQIRIKIEKLFEEYKEVLGKPEGF